MKQLKPVLAMLIALAVASPALAFNVNWHGDFNNRFMYSTQEDLAAEIFDEKIEYYTIDDVSNYSFPSGRFVKEEDDSGFNAQVKYRTFIEASDDEKKVKGVLGIEVGTIFYGSDQLPLGGDQTGVFELMWAYTDIQVPFDPASRLVVGLQPAKYSPFVWQDNASGIKWNRKEGPHTYSLAWWRTAWDGRGGDNSQETDIYAADYTYQMDTASINAFVIWRDKGVDNTFDGIIVEHDSEIWIGLAGTNTWNNLTATGSAIYLTGDVSTNSVTTPELDRSAYLLHAQADYKMDRYTFTLGGLYASGDDDGTDDKLDNFDHIDISTGLLGSVVIFDTYSDDDSLSDAYYAFDKGYKTIYAGVEYALNDKTDVWFKYFWHNSAEDLVDGEDEIGNEFVVGASYLIMKGLSADIAAGYLLAGDALDAAIPDGSADDVFRTDAQIRFKF